MPNIAYPPRRPLSVGEVLDLTFQVYRATLVKCLLPAALAVIAGQLTNVYALAKGGSVGGGGGWAGFVQTLQGINQDPVYWLVYVLATVASLLFYAVVTLRQYALITGRPVAGGFAARLRRAPQLVVGGVFGGGARGGLSLRPALLLSPPGRYLLAGLLLIPASYVAVLLSCAFTVLLLTGSGPVASYARS